MARQRRRQPEPQNQTPLTSSQVQPVKLPEQGIGNEPESAFHESRFQANLATVPVQRKAGSPEATTGKKQKSPNYTGLPDNLKGGVEQLSGLDMGDVRVHYNSSKPAQFNALAYTHGADIHVGKGQEKHLPHEAWHVVQQMQGRVRPTMQMRRKMNINDNQGLEKEADVMGAKASTINSKEDSSLVKKVTPIAEAVAQRKEGDPYSKNPDDLKEHMKGEWDGKANSELKGGHWLPGMKEKWGDNIQLDKQDDNQTDGMYFSALPKSSGNLPGFTLGKRPEWYIRKNRIKSGVKRQSSFWPPTWSWVEFKKYLSDSVERSESHKWETTNYPPGIIRWDSTSSGTNAFPYDFINKHPKPDLQ